MNANPISLVPAKNNNIDPVTVPTVDTNPPDTNSAVVEVDTGNPSLSPPSPLPPTLARVNVVRVRGIPVLPSIPPPLPEPPILFPQTLLQEFCPVFLPLVPFLPFLVFFSFLVALLIQPTPQVPFLPPPPLVVPVPPPSIYDGDNRLSPDWTDTDNEDLNSNDSGDSDDSLLPYLSDFRTPFGTRHHDIPVPDRPRPASLPAQEVLPPPPQNTSSEPCHRTPARCNVLKVDKPPVHTPPVSVPPPRRRLVGSSMIVHAHFNGIPVVALLDGACDTNLIGKSFYESNKYAIHVSPCDINLVYGNAETASTNLASYNNKISAQGYSFQVDFCLSPTDVPGVDIVLGNVFLDQESAFCGYGITKTCIFPVGKWYDCSIQAHFEDPNIQCISASAAARFLRVNANQVQACLIVIAPDSNRPPPLIRLPQPQPPELQSLLNRYPDVFSARVPDPATRRPTKIIDNGMVINVLPGTQPISLRPFQVSEGEMAIIQELIADLLVKGYIEDAPATSRWSAPVMLVKKPGNRVGITNQYRLVTDFRRVNKVTDKTSNVYTPPLIRDLFRSLAGAKLYSVTDIVGGFYQVPLHEDSRDFSTFVCLTPDGPRRYRFKCVTLGLCGAPSYFQSYVDQVLAGIKGVCPYFDDFLMFSSTFEEHLVILEQVFIRLREFALCLHPDKCQWIQTSIVFLGYKISNNSVLPSEEKLEALRSFVPPHDVPAVRRFLGFCQYLAHLIPHFNDRAAAISDLLKGGSSKRKFVWTLPCQTSFDDLRQSLIETKGLFIPSPHAELALETDASNFGVGACLYEVREGVFYPLYYLSAKFKTAERNYSPRDQEALAVVFGLTKLRGYLLCQHFTLYSDHQSLELLLTQPSLKGRDWRWQEIIGEFTFTHKYRAGSTMLVPDALSRGFGPNPVSQPPTGVLDTIYSINGIESPELSPLSPPRVATIAACSVVPVLLTPPSFPEPSASFASVPHSHVETPLHPESLPTYLPEYSYLHISSKREPDRPKSPLSFRPSPFSPLPQATTTGVPVTSGVFSVGRFQETRKNTTQSSVSDDDFYFSAGLGHVPPQKNANPTKNPSDTNTHSLPTVSAVSPTYRSVPVTVVSPTHQSVPISTSRVSPFQFSSQQFRSIDSPPPRKSPNLDLFACSPTSIDSYSPFSVDTPDPPELSPSSPLPELITVAECIAIRKDLPRITNIVPLDTNYKDPRKRPPPSPIAISPPHLSSPTDTSIDTIAITSRTTCYHDYANIKSRYTIAPLQFPPTSFSASSSSHLPSPTPSSALSPSHLPRPTLLQEKKPQDNCLTTQDSPLPLHPPPQFTSFSLSKFSRSNTHNQHPPVTVQPPVSPLLPTPQLQPLHRKATTPTPPLNHSKATTSSQPLNHSESSALLFATPTSFSATLLTPLSTPPTSQPQLLNHSKVTTPTPPLNHSKASTSPQPLNHSEAALLPAPTSLPPTRRPLRINPPPSRPLPQPPSSTYNVPPLPSVPSPPTLAPIDQFNVNPNLTPTLTPTPTPTSTVKSPPQRRRRARTNVINVADVIITSNWRETVSTFYEKDPFFAPILTLILQPLTDLTSNERTKIRRYVLVDNCLYYTLQLASGTLSNHDAMRLCLPLSPNNILRISALFESHDALLHQSAEKTYIRMHPRYYWPSMPDDIDRYVRSCRSCRTLKSRQRPAHGPISAQPIPDQRFDTIHLDFWVGLQKSPEGFDSVLLVIDSITRFIYLLPACTTDDALQTAKRLFSTVFWMHGPPKRLVSDRDPKFISDVFQSLMSLFNVQQSMSTSYNHNPNGLAEVSIKTVEVLLRHVLSHHPERSFVDFLPLAAFAFNSAAASAHSFSPYYSLFGFEPRNPSFFASDVAITVATPTTVADFVEHQQAVLAQSRDALATSQQLMETFVNRDRADYSFTINQLVYLDARNFSKSHFDRKEAKLHDRYFGPFPILEQVSPYTYRLQLPAGWRVYNVFHASLLWAHVPNPPDFAHRLSLDDIPPPVIPAPPVQPNTIVTLDEDEFVFTAVLGRRRRGRYYQYLVRWQGFPDSENSWISRASVGTSGGEASFDAFDATCISQEPPPPEE